MNHLLPANVNDVTASGRPTWENGPRSPAGPASAWHRMRPYRGDPGGVADPDRRAARYRKI